MQDEAEPTTAVKVTNAFGDTDEDLKRKYRLAPDTESFAKAALELVRPFVTNTSPLVREEGELVLGFLMAVLAGPVARAPLESRPKNKPHAGYSNIASTVLVCPRSPPSHDTTNDTTRPTTHVPTTRCPSLPGILAGAGVVG
jgi:hypothetical protein